MPRNFPSRFVSLVFILIVQNIVCFALDELSGSASVSPTGAATYSVAIEAPKGVGDLIPTVGITYNSQSGNGLVGFGCNITGLSAITRGTKTIAHDNTVKGISFDNNCALYLDGKRLLLKSGAEGYDGCVYSPEGEPMTNVTLHSSLTSSSCWFEVDTGDGMVYEFGHTDGRQMISNPTAVNAWNISKATNPMGQTITYQYSSDGLFLYPQTITYGAGNTINFVYENRTDSIYFSLHNQRGYVAKRLKTITTKAGSSIFRTYTMSYNTTSDGSKTKFSRLTSIDETGENGNSSHNLTAQWNYMPGFSANREIVNVNLSDGQYDEEYLDSYVLSGDVTGNGVDDIIRVSNVKVSMGYEYTLKTYIQVCRASVQNGEIEYDSPIVYKTIGSISTEFRKCLVRGTVFGDLDGDGIKDIIIPIFHEDGFAYLTFNAIFGKDIIIGNTNDIYGTRYIPCESGTPLINLTDFNRDGKVEILYLHKQESNGTYLCLLLANENGLVYTYPFNFSLSSTPQKIYTSDFNHDGLIDLMVISESGYRIFYNQGGTSLQNIFVNNSSLNTNVTEHDHLEPGDFNGDGILDFIWNDENSSQLYFEIGNANGTFTRRQAYNLPFAINYKNIDEGTWNCVVTDLDHDGKSDVVLSVAQYTYYGFPGLHYHQTHTYWLLSDGSSLTKKKEATSAREDDAKAGRLFVGDFKGNGYLDVANYGYDCYNGANADVDPTVNIYCCSSQGIDNGKATSFTDSNGRKTAFTYASMTSDLVYTKGTGSTYPIVDVAVPLCVTSQVNETGASSVSSQQHYTYAGLRAHLTGRGLLGFRSTTVSETNTGKVVTSTTGNDAPVFFVPRTNTITTMQAGTTSTVVDNATLCTYSYGSQTNYALFPTSQTATDIYGNVTSVTRTFDTNKGVMLVEREEKDDGEFYRKTTNVYGSAKIARAWRPISVEAEQKHPDDGSPFNQRTALSYNSCGQVTSNIEFQNTSKPLTTTYQYDSYGNITKEKKSGYGISNDTETNYQYDSSGKFLTRKSTTAGTVVYTRNAFGDLLSESDVTNPDNPLTTTYTRNGFGTLTKVIKPTGETTTWQRETTSEHGGAYCIKQNTLGRPETTTWYDALGNEVYTATKGIDNVDISSATTYNIRGEITSKVDVHGSLTMTENYTYDNLGRLLTSASSNGSSASYSYGNRETTVTKNGQEYTKTYNAWGDVRTSEDPITSVSYIYHSNGKPQSITADGNTVEIEYDNCGNQISLDDPDAGLTTYQYDAMHRIISQTDARGKVTTFAYDGAGRMTSKVVDGTATTYQYGTSGNGAGRLVSEQTGDRTITYAYDNQGRLSQETRSMAGEPSMTFGYTYNSNGTLASKTYPQGVTVDYVYEYGHCIATKIDSTNICLITSDDGLKKCWSVGGQLKYGNPLLNKVSKDGFIIHSGNTVQPMGGGFPYYPLDPNDPVPVAPDSLPTHSATLNIEYYYAWLAKFRHTAKYDARGYLTSLSNQRDSLLYTFQSGTGNLLSRAGMFAQPEAFTYDELDRLTSVSGPSQQYVYYDSDGGIAEKTGPGVYTYSTSHPHAVARVSNPMGSISSATQTATYTAFGKVQQLSDNGYTMDFTYGPDEERWKTVLRHNGSTVRTTLYADGYERITENGHTRHFYYLDGGVIYVLNDGASKGQFYYAFTDHLGSITNVYNESSQKVFASTYDAWGRQTVTLDTLGFHRGYTGHEMLPEFGLINMNGRLYDPILGRFLSPDNYVQMPDFSQSFNRYSYCLNNPLKYTDPDGETPVIGAIIGAVVGAYIGGVVTNEGELNPLNWNYTQVETYLGLFVGGVLGGVSGSVLGGSTMWNTSFVFSTPYATIGTSIGVSTGALGVGTKFNTIYIGQL